MYISVQYKTTGRSFLCRENISLSLYLLKSFSVLQTGNQRNQIILPVSLFYFYFLEVGLVVFWALVHQLVPIATQ